jgi:hypothetical protein
LLISIKMNEKQIKLGNRMAGLAMIVFGEAISIGTNNPFLEAGGALFVLEGAGDLVSGEHHYISGAILKYYFPSLGSKN